MYIIIHNGVPFITKWFDPENHFVTGMIVIKGSQYTIDGVNWFDMEEDHL